VTAAAEGRPILIGGQFAFGAYPPRLIITHVHLLLVGVMLMLLHGRRADRFFSVL
jgi:hypothetical protein